jgi:predicted GNAT family acetyltransferase
MRVERVGEAGQFLALTTDLRAREPVLTNLIGTIAEGVVGGRTYDSSFWWLVLADTSDEVVGAAMRTAPWNLNLSPMPAAAARALAASVAAADPGLPGVTGAPEVLDAFVAGLADAGRPLSPVVAMADVVLVLEDYRPPRGVPGAARRADPSEVDVLVEWQVAFARDAGVPTHDPEGSVRARLGTGATLWWEVDGVRVSMAAHAQPVRTPGGTVGRIGPVYTPPAHRRQGFGAAVTAAVVEELLPVCDTVMLFADAANPTSNGVYERLGFRRVGQVVEVSLHA